VPRTRDDEPMKRGGPPTQRDGQLAQIEAWFQGQIVGPHETRSKSYDERNAAAVPHIRPSKTLEPAERVTVYADMYFARLLDILAEEFVATRALCGPVEFERLVRAYLREHPSRHWSLNALGRKLPQFLAGPFRIPRKAVLHDVAQLESSIALVFDLPQSKVLTPADMARIEPAAFAGARVRLIDALELHVFDHGANAIVKAIRTGEKVPSLARARTCTVVWRKEWVVWRKDLDEPMFHVLSALKAGEPVQAAILAGAKRFEGKPEKLQAEISGAFGEWISEGMIAGIETG
jgi:putative DNA-binding protein